MNLHQTEYTTQIYQVYNKQPSQYNNQVILISKIIIYQLLMENKYQMNYFGQVTHESEQEYKDGYSKIQSNSQISDKQIQSRNQNINQPTNQNQIEINQTQKSSEKNSTILEDHLTQKFEELKSKYYDFFKNIIPNPQKYVPQMPTDNEFKLHKIKYLKGNKFYQNLQSYQQPYIRVKNTERQGTIVVYTVIIAIFELEITLLNIDEVANIQKNKIGQGSFGSVRIESQNKRMFAVKRQIFHNKHHLKQFKMTANGYEINQAIIELAIYKICSLLKIGPAAETDIGFDLICYRNCIEFQIQYCLIIEYKQGIFVDQSKFQKQIKQCLLKLHLHSIIHKDIKPGKLLFSIKYNKYVLTDFGISHPVIEKIGYRSKTHFQGTPQYMSDQMKKIVYGGEAGYVDLYGNDIYSLSTVLKKQITNQKIEQKLKQFNQKSNKQYQNIKYEYEYLKLKYYCIKSDSKMEEVQHYWKCMTDVDRLKQLIGIVDKSMEYNKIKSVYNYLSKQQNFKDYNLGNLRIQSQSIKSLKIEPDIKQNTQLQLKNTLRVYGYSLQVKEMIMKLKLQQKYPQTLKFIHKVLNKEQKYNLRDSIFGDHRNYIKKIKKQLQKFQQQKNNQQIFKRYMIILQFGNTTEQLETIEKLKKIQYKRKIEEELQQIIRVINIQNKKVQIQKFIKWADKKNEIKTILKKKRLERHVAEIYLQIGKYETALEYYNKSLNMYISFYGQQHPNVATTYNGIASVYDNMGKNDTAITYYTKSLNIDIAFHGQQHPNIAGTYNNIALIYNSMGKHEIALTYFIKSLHILILFHGQQHPNVARTYNNIALVYDSMGKYQIALTYYTKSLHILISFHGQQHPDVATTYNNIALVYDSLGKYDTTLNYYTKNLNILIPFHGQQHPSIARTYNNIASVYDSMGKNDVALTYYTKSLHILITFHGQQHPTIAITYNGIALTYKNMGKYETALEYYNKSLNIYISFYGQQHPNVATTYNGIASVYDNMGKYQTALIYFTKSLNMDISLYGQQHPNIARTYNNIAGVYDKMGKYETALTYYNKSLNIFILFHGQQHPTIATRYNNIASVYNSMGNYQTALTYFTKSVRVDISFHGQQHPKIAITYNNVASVYDSMGKYQTALTYYTKSVNILIPFHGQQHPTIAITYNNVAINYLYLGNLISAHKYIYKSISIGYKFIMTTILPLIANNYHTLSNIFLKKTKYAKSLHYAYFALDTFLKFNPLDHPVSPSYFQLIAQIYYQMNRFIQSYFFYRLSCQILVRYFPIHHTNVRNSKHMMNEMEWSMPQSIHNYTSNIEFVNNINNKYSQLPKHKLIKLLFAKKSQLRFEQQHRSRRDSFEYLKCMIQIYLCYKYLGYLREQQKIRESIKKELQRIQQSQQKQIFRGFIKEISISLK